VSEPAACIQGLTALMSINGGVFPAFQVFGMTFMAVIVGGFIEPMLRPPAAHVAASDGTWAIRSVQANAAVDHDGAAHPAFYFDFEPPLVVMTTDQQMPRNLELHIKVRVGSEEALAKVRLHEPAITSSLLNQIYGRDFRSLGGREGKETLRRECLEEAQRVLVRETGATVIDDLYFTYIFFQ
jgi:flagellar basal body-associated protein FliL